MPSLPGKSDLDGRLFQAAIAVVEELAKTSSRIVLAESCTAGLVSASLGRVPGVSDYLCGSAVVYREQTKIAWLGVDPQVLATASAVSEAATESIARGALINTPEAHYSLGITGHLGPGCPEDLDGRVFVSCWPRSTVDIGFRVSSTKRLEAESRHLRQQAAAVFAMQVLLDFLKAE